MKGMDPSEEERYRFGPVGIAIIGAALCHGHIARLMDLLSPMMTGTGSG
ncbi:hypothetical protein [Methanosphaerula subterraneus]